MGLALRGAARALLRASAAGPRGHAAGTLSARSQPLLPALPTASPHPCPVTHPPPPPTPFCTGSGLFHFDPKTPEGIEWHFMLHGCDDGGGGRCAVWFVACPACSATPLSTPDHCTHRTAHRITAPPHRRHHHKYPMDFDRLGFPPLIAALVIAMFYGLLHLIFPPVRWGGGYVRLWGGRLWGAGTVGVL